MRVKTRNNNRGGVERAGMGAAGVAGGPHGGPQGAAGAVWVPSTSKIRLPHVK